jgi:ATP-dependent RNA helicase DDX56/DBP9
VRFRCQTRFLLSDVTNRYHTVQEFNKGVYDYIIATDESGARENKIPMMRLKWTLMKEPNLTKSVSTVGLWGPGTSHLILIFSRLHSAQLNSGSRGQCCDDDKTVSSKKRKRSESSSAAEPSKYGNENNAKAAIRSTASRVESTLSTLPAS